MVAADNSISAVEQQRVAEFREQLEAALATVRNVLDSDKRVLDPASTQHTYEDKFTLVNHLSNVALNAIGNALEPLGLTSAVFDALSVSARARRTVLLTFKSRQSCEFEREETREVEFPTVASTASGSSSCSGTKTRRRVVTRITEYFWKFSYTYELACTSLAFNQVGSVGQDNIFSESRTRHLELKTSTRESPQPASSERGTESVTLSLLALRWSPEQHSFEFSIDRSDSSCHTPKRNDDVEYGMAMQLEQLKEFCEKVLRFYNDHLEKLLPPGVDQRPSTRVDEVSKKIFLPVVAVFDEATSTVLRIEDADKLIGEQVASIASTVRHLDASFEPPESSALISSAEARIMALMTHTCSLITQYLRSIQYVEDMLSQQLVAAIGKKLSVRGFAEYMRFHNNRKLLKPQYALTPFCHAVVRPEHTPEGLISMETADGDVICTSVRKRPADPHTPMKCAIGAATTVNITGTHYVHGWLGHTFSSASKNTSKLTLVARARQFSSYIVLLGTVSSATAFQAKHAVILQNRDDLRIPLLLDEIPTQKDFRDAIESLSPEQQRFARACRSVQLEGSLFVCCVVQIKPAMERLLGLAPDSLTKEVKLTQDLMELFTKFQIPSDVISFGGDDSPPAADRLEAVRKHVSGIYDMVAESKERELAEAREQQRKNEAEAGAAPVAGASAPVWGPSDIQIRNVFGHRSEPPVRRSEENMRSLDNGAEIEQEDTATGYRDDVEEICENPMAAGGPAPGPDLTAESARDVASEGGDATEPPEDYTRLPVALNRALDTREEDAALDEESTVRPTVIKVGRTWTKRVQKGLLSPRQKTALTPEHQETARNQAFDLLDALSRSGSLCLEEAELHIVVAGMHRFDRTLLETVIQRNTNPIERVERAVLMMASTIHQVEPSELVASTIPDESSSSLEGRRRRRRFLSSEPTVFQGSEALD